MKNIAVSFITINYNSSLYTIELLKSIEHFTSNLTNYEIIVVDNASREDEFKLLKDFMQERTFCKLISNRINSGFATGNMLGANYAQGKY